MAQKKKKKKKRAPMVYGLGAAGGLGVRGLGFKGLRGLGFRITGVGLQGSLCG